ncbi:methyltransferase domain-containing protein [Bacillus licheniformis]
MSSFSFEEFVKIFLLVLRSVNPLSVKHISFEPLMKDMYRDYQGVRHINVYKKRIIEACLKEMSISDLLYGEVPVNEHVSLAVQPFDQASEIVGVTFSFSQAGLKLIEFCQEAEKSPLYERAIVLLYDFFEFRKDSFDRLQNEAAYLSDMNGAEDYKKKIADYAVGERMLDIGAGGGVMLDLLTDQHPEAEVIGIDLSVNVIEELQKRKVREHKPWHVKQADALDLPEYFEQESVDTIVFSSILHELFSYIPYEGKKFNHLVIAQALKSSFDILKPGGRIIIRDGIMTENKRGNAADTV